MKSLTVLQLIHYQNEERLSETEKRQEKHDIASRKNNLKFYGVAYSDNETSTQVEQNVYSYCTDTLGVNPDEVHIDYSYRLSNKKESPILVRFSSRNAETVPSE